MHSKIRQRSVDHTKRSRESAWSSPTISLRTQTPASKCQKCIQAAWRLVKRRWFNLLLLLVLCYAFLRFTSRRRSPPRVARSALKKRDACSFQPSHDPLPVFTNPDRLLYHNGPMSDHRPVHQFADCTAQAPKPFARPALVLITAAKDPGPYFDVTLANVQAQSLQNFRWLIIDDHSTNATSLKRLSTASQDPRITIIRNAGEPGLAASRNVGLDAIDKDVNLQAPYIAMLDDDDLYELTTLEKAVWMLESNPQWALASYYFVKFGAQNVTETRGVHNGVVNYLAENYVANAAVIRRIAIPPCRYDLSFAAGGEDWDFWMCLADNGKWGGTLPELAYWYRVNDKLFRKERWGDTFDGGQRTLREKIQAKHGQHEHNIYGFPNAPPAPAVSLESFSWQSPVENALVDTAATNSILFIIPWLFMGGADIGALRQVETLTKQGYRVTVVCTLYQAPEGLELRPLMMQWTHDVHVLPSFLRAKDFPKYIKYLAETRQARTIFMSNSMLAYEMLPALREQLPDAVFVDYLHNEAYDGWKSGGYPTYSILHQRYLDRSISCSHHLKEWMVERGHTADRIGVVKLGVDLEKISEAHGQAKPALKHQLYDADPDSAVILSVARLDPQKRSLLMPDIISDLITYHGYSCGPIDSERIPVLMVMVGSGILEDALRDKIEEMGLTECFYLAGVQTDVSAYYQSADLFLLPSVSEGISVAVSEAMAAGLPVVAANAGALPEQIGREDDELRAGVVVTPSNRPEEHSALYAMAIDQLLSDPDLMDEYADNGLQRVQKSDWRSTLLGLLPELDLARAAHDNPRSLAELVELPHPAAHLALQTQLDEFKPFVDFSLVHSSLSAPTREGFGRELQVRCGDNADNSDWIDALEEPAICDRKHAADARALQESAKYQCGSWCIWDLRTEERTGWVFNGQCFKPLTGNTCQTLFNLRPRRTLNQSIA